MANVAQPISLFNNTSNGPLFKDSQLILIFSGSDGCGCKWLCKLWETWDTWWLFPQVFYFIDAVWHPARLPWGSSDPHQR